ncbi:hypothetical protein [Glutamicibacter nicotianae]
MPSRNGVLPEPWKLEPKIRLAALREAIRAGAADIETGRSTKLEHTDIDDFVMALSQEANREAKRWQSPAR